MEEMMKVLKRKSQIVYDMNCIEKYMQPGEFDESLSKAWNSYKAELDLVEDELRLLSNPETRALEEQKLSLLHQIEDHNKEIAMLKHQISEIDRKMTVLV